MLTLIYMKMNKYAIPWQMFPSAGVLALSNAQKRWLLLLSDSLFIYYLYLTASFF